MRLLDIAWKYESPAMFLKIKDFPHIVLSKAKGVYFWDERGYQYLDMTSFFGVMNFGHSPDFVIKILNSGEFLIHGLGDLFTNIYRIKFLKKISEILGGNYKGILSTTGSEACELAIKTAHLYTGKEYVISFENSYHGLSGISLSLTDKFQKRYFKPFLFKKILRVPFPDEKNPEEKVIKRIENLLKKYSVSSIILEPIQGRGGINFTTPLFFKELEEISRKHGVLLIFDEVFTGLRRTGKIFAFEWYQVKPDIICLGKGIASGFPLSVCLGRSEIMEAWRKEERETLHASTFGGHPFACRVGIEVLRRIENQGLERKIISKGEYILQKLFMLKEKYGKIIKNIRGKGLLIGIELNSAFKIWKSLLLEERIFTLLEGKNLNTLCLSPPFIITYSQIDDFLYRFENSLKKAI